MQRQASYLNIFRPKLIRGLLSLAVKGYFVETGWQKAYLKKESIGKNDNPIPWLTYSFLDFIEGRLTNNLRVFEYGSGNSTLYYANYVKYIRAIENDKSWYEKIKSQVPENVSVLYKSLVENEYVNAISEEKELFDIVIIDGRERVECTKNSIQKLTEQGVIIFDDAERGKYQSVFDLMKENGFKHLPFTGIAIGAIHKKSTVLFYRNNNCLGI